MKAKQTGFFCKNADMSPQMDGAVSVMSVEYFAGSPWQEVLPYNKIRRREKQTRSIKAASS